MCGTSDKEASRTPEQLANLIDRASGTSWRGVIGDASGGFTTPGAVGADVHGRPEPPRTGTGPSPDPHMIPTVDAASTGVRSPRPRSWQRHSRPSGGFPPNRSVLSRRREKHIVLPAACRAFLIELGGSGAGPFYGRLPLEECRLFTMNRKPADGSPRMGCGDLCLIAVTGPPHRPCGHGQRGRLLAPERLLRTGLPQLVRTVARPHAGRQGQPRARTDLTGDHRDRPWGFRATASVTASRDQSSGRT